jgi:class 3 adenylate cyclase
MSSVLPQCFASSVGVLVTPDVETRLLVIVGGMARLDPRERAGLPDRAFAYIDSSGRRRLPIHDPAHVRNALARFGQVAFEDEKSRDRARTRLLNAAKKYKIVPIGFIATQLESARAARQRRDEPVVLPSGFVTLLMTDIEGSTALVHHLGERYGSLIEDLCAILRQCASTVGGYEVEARADEFFAAFEAPRAAVDAAVAIQRQLIGRAWTDDLDVRVRIGIHSGYPTSTDTNYIGMDVHTTSRICAVGHGQQIVVSGSTREAVKASAPDGVRFTSLGSHRLRGLPAEVALYQVAAKGLPTRFPLLRTSAGG